MDERSKNVDEQDIDDVEFMKRVKIIQRCQALVIIGVITGIHLFFTIYVWKSLEDKVMTAIVIVISSLMIAGSAYNLKKRIR